MDNEVDAIIHREATREIADCKFSVQALAHLVRYEKAANLFIETSKLFGRPISVLSVGCGEMRELQVFWNSFWVKKSDVLSKYIGIDVEICDIPVANTQKKVEIEIVKQDLMENTILPFQGESFDLVIAMEFIEHLPRQYAKLILGEMARVMSKGSILYLSTPNGSVASQNKYHYYQYSLDEMKSLFISFGLRLKETYGDFISSKYVTSNRFGPNFGRIFAATNNPLHSDCVSYLCVK